MNEDMEYHVLADLVVVAHLAFVVFAAFGALLVLKQARWAWLQAPAFLWAAALEIMGWRCPLTPLENWLRAKGGGSAYASGFVEHYLLPVLYPAGLTREAHIVLGVLVVGINLALYGWLWRRALRR